MATVMVALGLVAAPHNVPVSQAAASNLVGPNYYSSVTLEPFCLFAYRRTGGIEALIDGDFKSNVLVNYQSLDKDVLCASYPQTNVYDVTYHVELETPAINVTKVLIWNDVGITGDGIKKGIVTLYDPSGAVLTTVNFDKLPSSGSPASIVLPGTFQNVASFTVLQQETYAGGGAGNATQLRELGLYGEVPPPAPKASVTKTGTLNDTNGDGIAGAGESISYAITITNTGKTDLTSLSVSDPLVTAVSCPVTTLKIGVSTTCTGTHTITAADLAAGSLTNTATATFADASGATGSATGSTTTTLPPVSRLQVTKSSAVNASNPDGAPRAGDTISYTITVDNSGNTEITGLSVADPKGSPTCAATTLAPGASTTCTLDYVVTQSDIDAGSVANTASATGTDPSGATITATGATTTTLTPKADVTVAKTGTFNDTDGDGFAQAGETITFTIVATNTGNLYLSSVPVTDPLGTPACDVAGGLAPGASKTCTLTYTITYDDIVNGGVANTATVAAVALNGAKATGTDTTNVTLPLKGEISIVKAAGDAPMVAGSSVNYQFFVTNTGGLALSNIALDDNLTTDEACPKTTLAAFEQMICTASYVITQADVDAGSFTNNATVSAQTPAGDPVSASGSAVFPVDQTPAMAVTKTGVATDANGDGIVNAGETITYSIIVENTGNVTLDPVSVSDPLVSDLSCPQTKLNPTQHMTCTGTHVLTAAEVASGSVGNTASATGTPPSGTPYSTTGTTTTPIAHEGQLTVAKSAAYDTGAPLAPGDQITYTITVTNTGNVAVNDVAVTDPFGTPSCDATSLDPGAGATCTLVYTVTQADVDAGQINNFATASATTTDGVAISGAGTTKVDVPTTATASLTKTSELVDTNADGIASAGDTVNYTIVVTNTGNVTLSPVSVNDPKIASLSCDVTTLAPGAKATCTGSYTVTQADVTAGGVENSASVSAVPPSGPAVTATGGVTTDLPASPALSVAVDGVGTDPNENGIIEVGEEIVYGVTVTNTGNVVMDQIAVTDSSGGVLDCPETTLAPGASVECTITYPVTQAQVDAGTAEFTAIATGTAPSGATATTDGSMSTPLAQTPALSVTKSTADTVFAAGAVVNYTIVVSNTGNVTVTGISLDDPLTSNESCPASVLAPGAQMQCTASYVVTQADVDAGSYDNTATATGTAPDGSSVTNSGSVTFPVDPAPALSLAKSGLPVDSDGDGQVEPGETVEYMIKVTNTGNVTVSNVAVADPKGTPVCDQTTLVPGATATCRLTYLLTATDIDSGTVANSATASATAPDGTPLSASGSATTAVFANPMVTTVKSVTGDFTVGTTLNYSIVVTNSGNVTLSGIAIDDPLTSNEACPQSTLAAAEQMVCTASYTITQADIDSGSVGNTATVTGSSPDGVEVSDSGSATSPFEQAPAVTLTETGVPNDLNSNGQIDPGDTITYTITATNTGNVTVTDLAVTDGSGGTVTCTPTTLVPGQMATCTVVYTLTAADIDAGTVSAGASATATAPDGSTPAAEVTTSNTITPAPSATVVKSATGTLAVGETVTYTLVVTNTGNVTLDPIALDDPLTSDEACPATSLGAGDQMTCTATYVVTQADVDAGKTTNSATVTATTPNGATITAEGANTVTYTQTPAVELTTSTTTTDANTNGQIDPGETVDYTFTVTNTGNVTVDQISVGDALGTPTCDATSLAPGESTTCTLSYPATATDVDAGSVTNQTTVTAQAPDGTSVGDTGSVLTAITPVPTATVDYTVTSVTETEVNYSVVVTNTGNVTLSSVDVTDPQATRLTCPETTLAAGAEMTCTATHTLTQAEIDAGSLTSTATMTATDPTGGTVTAGDLATATITPDPALSVTTTNTVTDTNGDGNLDPGETLTSTIVVTNTGNVTVTNVSVADSLGTVECPTTTLAPGEQVECQLVHALTQAEVDSGSITSDATATGTTPSGASTSGTGDATTAIAPAPSMSVITTTEVSDHDGDGLIEPGDTVSYLFAVTNTGNVTLDPVSVADNLGTVVCTPETIEAGQTAACRLTHTLTAAEIDSGALTNTATITATAPDGTNLTDSSTSTTPIKAQSGISVVTSVEGDLVVGETLTTTVVVTNTGNVTLTDVGATDVATGDLFCPQSSLAAGEQMVCTTVDVVTQADVDAGAYVNSATVVGTDPSGTVVKDSSTGDTSSPPNPDVAVTLSGVLTDSNLNGVADPGETLTYTVVVTNTGNTTLDAVSVTDPLGTPVCDKTTLAPGEQATCLVAHVLTAEELNTGSLTNTVVASASAPDGSVLTDSASTSTTLTPKAGVSVVKSVSGTYAAGETLTYTFVVTNTGNVTLNPVALDDPLTTNEACPSASLLPGKQMICTASLVLTAQQASGATFTNTATVTATDPNGTVVTGTGAAVANQAPAPATSVSTTTQITDTNLNGQLDPGEEVTTTITVTNTGNVPISDLVVTAPSGTATCDTTTLVPGQFATCTVSGQLTQAQIDAGAVQTSVTVTATAPDGSTLTQTDTTSVQVAATSGMTITKSAGEGVLKAGEVVSYQIVVTNTGTATLTKVAIDDPLTTDETCPKSSLGGGEQMTCTASYVLTQADVDAGTVINRVTGSAVGATGVAAGSGSQVRFPVQADPSLNVVVSGDVVDVNGDGVVKPGDEVRYSVAITNNGNQTISNIAAQFPGATLDCPGTTLAPGQTMTCTLTHVITQAELDAGGVSTEGAQVLGTLPNGTTISQGSGPSTVPLPVVGNLLVTKTGKGVDRNGDSKVSTGDQIEYSITVTNAGNVTVTDLVVQDPITAKPDCPATTLAPGEKMTCTVTYTVSAADAAAGSVTNTASASGVGAGMTAGNTTVAATGQVTTAVANDPAGPGGGDPPDTGGQTSVISHLQVTGPLARRRTRRSELVA